jgi:hypothetical protein
MLKPKEIAEISLALWYLPLDKLEQVRDLVYALKKEHGFKEPIDDSDEWTEEDRQDLQRAFWQRVEEENAESEEQPVTERTNAQAG